MATVSGVWVWNETLYVSMDTTLDQTIQVTSNGITYDRIYGVGVIDSSTLDLYLSLTYSYGMNRVSVYSSSGWENQEYRTIDFGSTPQTVSDQFYTYLTANATQQASPSEPSINWANSFVKTSSGNKAVQKVWIKQNGQLVTVWDGGGGGGAAVDFATDSWETISAACKDGSHKTVYQVGDTKDITLSTGETITVAIMGFDHDDLSDGSGKAPITLGMTELLATTYPMNSTNTNVGGWDESKMRTSTMAALLSQLPSELQSTIKQVNKKATAGSKSTVITTSADKLWLFAEVEVDGTTSVGYADEGEQYEYWKTVKNGKKDSDRIRKKSNGSGSVSDWWLRTPSLNYATTFRKFGSGGYLAYGTATFREGVSFGFCIG